MNDSLLSKVIDIRSNINRECVLLDRLKRKEAELSEMLDDRHRLHLWPLWFKWFLIGVLERRSGKLCTRIDSVERKIERWKFVADTLLDVEYADDFLREGY